jgi:hypothetical protein
MGFVRKITGVQGQIDATNRNTDAQNNATKQAAQAQAAALQASAQAAADGQAQAAARSAAEQKAADAVSAPLDQADVQLQSNNTDQTTTEQRRTRQASYGRNYSGGVSI